LGLAIKNAGDNSILRSDAFALFSGAISGGVGSVLGGGNFWMAAGVISIAVLGFAGFLFREKIFDIIVKHYKKEKYSTLDAFKNKA